MYFLKNFNNHSEYEAFVSGGTMELPNISRCITQTELHYNPREVDPYNGHAYVDFNLPSGTMWAKKNVGATNEYDNGLFFAWGETVGYTPDQVTGSSTPHKDFSMYDYQFFTDIDIEQQKLTITKYNTNSNFGPVDGLTKLETIDDAARTNMGGSWRMPTVEEVNELLDNTYKVVVSGESITYWDDNVGDYATITTNKFNGKTGLLFYLRTTTPDVAFANDEYLFFPMAGNYYEGEEYAVGTGVTFFSSNLVSEGPFSASGLVMTISDYENFGAKLRLIERFAGACVRGVVGEPLPNIVSVNGYEYDQWGQLYFDTLKDFTIIVSTPISGSATMLVDYENNQHTIEHYEVPLTISGDGLTLTGSLSQALDNNLHTTTISVSHSRGVTNTFKFLGNVK